MIKTLQFNLNDKPLSIEVDDERILLWVLRTDLGLTGAKFGRGEGLCGACTVLVDDEAMPSCQISVGYVAGREVKTIEGLAGTGSFTPFKGLLSSTMPFNAGSVGDPRRPNDLVPMVRVFLTDKVGNRSPKDPLQGRGSWA